MDDFEQVAFLALLEALEGWDDRAGSFLTWYGLKLRGAFSEASGQRTKRDQLDPIQSAVSLETPLADREGDLLYLEDVIPDPRAEEAWRASESGKHFTGLWTACQEHQRTVIPAAVLAGAEGGPQGIHACCSAGSATSLGYPET